MSPFEQLQTTIAHALKVPAAQVRPDTCNEDLPAWDSLGQVNLIMALEQTFGVYIEVEEFENLKSVPAIMAFLEAQGQR